MPTAGPSEPFRKPDGTAIPNNAVTGFIRVEPLGGDADTLTEAGSPVEKEWFQWEVILSRWAENVQRYDSFVQRDLTSPTV